MIAGVLHPRYGGSAGCLPGQTRYYLEREGDRALLFSAIVTRTRDERPAKLEEALAAGYALRNADGTLTLPELPNG